VKNIRHHNIDHNDKVLIWERQGRCCGVCGELAELSELKVDHDHACCPGWTSCGRCVRGLLHPRCNTILGHHESSLADEELAYLAAYKERGPYVRLDPRAPQEKATESRRGVPLTPEHRANISAAHRGRRHTWSNRLDAACRNGHARTEANTYRHPDGHRSCRDCRRPVALSQATATISLFQ